MKATEIRTGAVSVRRFGPAFASLTLVAALVAAAVPAGGDSNQGSTYRGHFVDGSNATIRFEVQRRRGVRRKAEVEAFDVVLACSDGVDQRATFQPSRFPFRRENVFYARKRSFNDHIGSESRYEVRGRLIPGGRARGYLEYEEEYSYPFPPDCATRGRLRWEARR